MSFKTVLQLLQQTVKIWYVDGLSVVMHVVFRWYVVTGGLPGNGSRFLYVDIQELGKLGCRLEQTMELSFSINAFVV